MANKSIGQFIAVLRKANGMTQQDVADRLNVSNKAVSRWERDECAPDISLIPALAEMFGVTCDELLKGERILEPPQEGKREAKAEKQLRAIVNRTISGFKTMILISIALSVVGLVCMFGISYGFYRPIVGFAVMALFEAAAAVIAVIAVSRMKDSRENSELFENADSKLTDKFNKSLGSFSFSAFFAVVSVILLSIPLLIDVDHNIGVLAFESYVQWFLWIIVLVLILAFIALRGRYVAWITEEPYNRRGSENDSDVKRMTVMQITAVVLSAVLFFAAPYFLNTNIIEMIGLAFLVINIALFVIYMIKRAGDRGQMISHGIRNIIMGVPACLVSMVHRFYILYDIEEQKSVMGEYWKFEYLIYIVGFLLLDIIVFKVVDILIEKRSKGKSCDS